MSERDTALPHALNYSERCIKTAREHFQSGNTDRAWDFLMKAMDHLNEIAPDELLDEDERKARHERRRA